MVDDFSFLCTNPGAVTTPKRSNHAAGRKNHTYMNTQVNVSIQHFYRPHLMLTACQKENDSGDPQRLWFIQKPHTDNLQPHAKCCTSKQVKKTKQLRAKELNTVSGSESPHCLLTQQWHDNA